MLFRQDNFKRDKIRGSISFPPDKDNFRKMLLLSKKVIFHSFHGCP